MPPAHNKEIRNEIRKIMKRRDPAHLKVSDALPFQHLIPKKTPEEKARKEQILDDARTAIPPGGYAVAIGQYKKEQLRMAAQDVEKRHSGECHTMAQWAAYHLLNDLKAYEPNIKVVTHEKGRGSHTFVLVGFKGDNFNKEELDKQKDTFLIIDPWGAAITGNKGNTNGVYTVDSYPFTMLTRLSCKFKTEGHDQGLEPEPRLEPEPVNQAKRPHRYKFKHDRWHSFYTPLRHENIMRRIKNVRHDDLVVADWNEMANHISVNGKPLGQIINRHPCFESMSELKSFMRNHLLKNLDQGHNEEEILDYMLKTFRKDGLLAPVSDYLSQEAHTIFRGKMQAPENPIRRLALVSTSSGIMVQEKVAQQEMVDKKSQVHRSKDGTPVYTLSATFDLKFKKKNRGQDEIADVYLKQSSISYGDEKIQKLMDTRGLFSRFTDFIKRLIGRNYSEDLAQVVDAPAGRRASV